MSGRLERSRAQSARKARTSRDAWKLRWSAVTTPSAEFAPDAVRSAGSGLPASNWDAKPRFRSSAVSGSSCRAGPPTFRRVMMRVTLGRDPLALPRAMRRPFPPAGTPRAPGLSSSLVLVLHRYARIVSAHLEMSREISPSGKLLCRNKKWPGRGRAPRVSPAGVPRGRARPPTWSQVAALGPHIHRYDSFLSHR